MSPDPEVVSFHENSPIFTESSNQPPTSTMNLTNDYIIKSLALLSILILPGISCQTLTSKKNQSQQERYEKSKKSLAAEEEKIPQHLLAVTGYNRKNIVGQTVIKGTITNKATIAVFKDVALTLSFYSKTHDLLDTEQETVYEVIHPGESKDFKTKYFAPKGTDSVGITVSGAGIVP